MFTEWATKLDSNDSACETNGSSGKSAPSNRPNFKGFQTRRYVETKSRKIIREVLFNLCEFWVPFRHSEHLVQMPKLACALFTTNYWSQPQNTCGAVSLTYLHVNLPPKNNGSAFFLSQRTESCNFATTRPYLRSNGVIGSRAVWCSGWAEIPAILSTWTSHDIPLLNRKLPFNFKISANALPYQRRCKWADFGTGLDTTKVLLNCQLPDGLIAKNPQISSDQAIVSWWAAVITRAV